MQQHLDKEVSLGRKAGPFDKIPFPTSRISHIGLIPIKDGDFCLVRHGDKDEAVLIIQL